MLTAGIFLYGFLSMVAQKEFYRLLVRTKRISIILGFSAESWDVKELMDCEVTMENTCRAWGQITGLLGQIVPCGTPQRYLMRPDTL